jgi:hypothetical protein
MKNVPFSYAATEAMRTAMQALTHAEMAMRTAGPEIQNAELISHQEIEREL